MKLLQRCRSSVVSARNLRTTQRLQLVVATATAAAATAPLVRTAAAFCCFALGTWCRQCRCYFSCFATSCSCSVFLPGCLAAWQLVASAYEVRYPRQFGSSASMLLLEWRVACLSALGSSYLCWTLSLQFCVFLCLPFPLALCVVSPLASVS